LQSDFLPFGLFKFASAIHKPGIGDDHQQPVQKLVICAKCGAENDRQLDRCQGCGTHLYLKCQSCGQVNERRRSRCQACGHHLRRSFWREFQRKLFSREVRVRSLQVALVVVALLLLYWYISRLGHESPFNAPSM